MEINETSLNLINTQRKNIKEDRPELFKRLLALEELYSEYNFMIYDLPVFKFDDEELFQKIWKENNIDCGRIKADIASPYTVDSTPRFRCLDIIDKYQHITKIWKSNYKDLSKEFPLFYQQMNDLLPFDDITYVRLWQSIGPISMHRDDSWWYFNIPTELRIMIYDENKTGTFKVQPELVPSDLKYVNIPKETNTFGWNNVRCMHGSDKFDNTEKLLACITGAFNSKKLRNLFENSCSKFNNDKNKTLNDPYSQMLFR